MLSSLPWKKKIKIKSLEMLNVWTFFRYHP